MADVFTFKSYAPYLSELCQQERGMLTRLAEAASCQKSYLSTCLKGKTQLTMDQAYGISEYLNLSEGEQEYFFLLVEKERASTLNFKKHCEKKLLGLSREAYRLKNQTRNSGIVSKNDSAQLAFYYQTWLPSAIHMCTSVGKFQTTKSIAQRLRLPEPVVQGVLNELHSQSLVNQKGQNYSWGSTNIHLPDDNPMITSHHQNWRMRALEDIQRGSVDSLHYSVVQSMSEADFETLKKKITSYIRSFHSVADPSESEEVFCFNIDFFKT